jgi:16S rRNA (uracil1498-N3)-methyltransferase
VTSRPPAADVNLILFESEEIDRPLDRGDPRAAHILQVLRRRPGDTFDAGIVNGPRGRGTLIAVGPAGLTLSFEWGEPPRPLPPITLVVGLPRPQSARDILRDGTSLGVAAMHFVSTDRADPSYGHSTLWTSGEWRRRLIAGAEQAFDTRLPEVTWGRPLRTQVETVAGSALRLALDHYEAAAALPEAVASARAGPRGPGAVLAFGPERGWADSERAFLRGAGFSLVHLGSRVLRTETAVTAAVMLVRAGLELM